MSATVSVFALCVFFIFMFVSFFCVCLYYAFVRVYVCVYRCVCACVFALIMLWGNHRSALAQGYYDIDLLFFGMVQNASVCRGPRGACAANKRNSWKTEKKAASIGPHESLAYMVSSSLY